MDQNENSQEDEETFFIMDGIQPMEPIQDPKIPSVFSEIPLQENQERIQDKRVNGIPIFEKKPANSYNEIGNLRGFRSLNARMDFSLRKQKEMEEKEAEDLERLNKILSMKSTVKGDFPTDKKVLHEKNDAEKSMQELLPKNNGSVEKLDSPCRRKLAAILFEENRKRLKSSPSSNQETQKQSTLFCVDKANLRGFRKQEVKSTIAVTPVATPAVTPKVTPEIIPKVTPKVTPEGIAEIEVVQEKTTKDNAFKNGEAKIPEPEIVCIDDETCTGTAQKPTPATTSATTPVLAPTLGTARPADPTPTPVPTPVNTQSSVPACIVVPDLTPVNTPTLIVNAVPAPIQSPVFTPTPTPASFPTPASPLSLVLFPIPVSSPNPALSPTPSQATTAPTPTQTTTTPTPTTIAPTPTQTTTAPTSNPVAAKGAKEQCRATSQVGSGPQQDDIIEIIDVENSPAKQRQSNKDAKSLDKSLDKEAKSLDKEAKSLDRPIDPAVVVGGNISRTLPTPTNLDKNKEDTGVSRSRETLDVTPLTSPSHSAESCRQNNANAIKRNGPRMNIDLNADNVKKRSRTKRPAESDVCFLQERDPKEKYKNLVPHTVDDGSDSDICIVNEEIRVPRKTLNRKFQTLKCSECSFKTNSMAQFRNHEAAHPKGRKIKCSKCNFQTRLKSCMIYHSAMHSGGKKFRCAKCNFKTDVLDRFLEHESLKFTCCFCQKTYHESKKLEQHIERMHQEIDYGNDETFQCDRCSYSCGNESEFEKHQMQHRKSPENERLHKNSAQERREIHKNSTNGREMLHKNVRDEGNKLLHKNTVQERRESLRNKATEDGLDIVEIKQKRGRQPMNSSIDPGSKKTNSNSSAILLGYKRKRGRPSKFNHVSTPSIDKIPKKPNPNTSRANKKLKKRKPWFCPSCNFKTLHENILQNHIQKKHIESHYINGEFQCPECFFVTDEKLFFENHLKNHAKLPDFSNSDKQIFKCSVCDFETEFEGMMQSHLSTHTDNDSDFEIDTSVVPVAGADPTLGGMNPALSGADPALAGMNPALPGMNPSLPGSNPALAGTNPALAGANPTFPGANPTLPKIDNVNKKINRTKVDRPKKFHCRDCDFQTNLEKRFECHRALHLRQKVYNIIFSSVV